MDPSQILGKMGRGGGIQALHCGMTTHHRTRNTIGPFIRRVTGGRKLELNDDSQLVNKVHVG